MNTEDEQKWYCQLESRQWSPRLYIIDNIQPHTKSMWNFSYTKSLWSNCQNLKDYRGPSRTCCEEGWDK